VKRAVPRSQLGVAAVEFALVSMVFFSMLLGVIEMGRIMWTWNAAAEATRLGARLAVVCDLNDAIITTRMSQMLPSLSASNVTVTWSPSSCTAATCTSVQVQLTGYTHQTIIPLAPISVTLPPFSTSLRKEFMQSAGNSVCS
jgi:Flp pilus assembly protein TadG